jgi:EAL domain-containing protein (putative c-di-GMP-specific phosphodiesterase class I)
VHQVEALIRWDHPARGLLYPDSFLTLVEDAGLMGELTQRVLARRWTRRRSGRRPGGR